MSILSTLGLRGGSRAEAETTSEQSEAEKTAAEKDKDKEKAESEAAESEAAAEEDSDDDGEDMDASGEDEEDPAMAAAAARVRRAEGALPRSARRAARTYATACVDAAHARVAAVLSHKAAKGREAMALTLVCDTSLTPRQAIKRLETMPKAGASLGERIETQGAGPVAPGGRMSGDKDDPHGWGRSVAKVNKPRSFN